MKISSVIEALHSLAQETRLSVFRLLVEVGPTGKTAGDIAKSLKVPPATMSFHLAHLARANLISATREGRSIRYTLDYGGVQSLLAYLMDDCCQGNPQLCGISVTDRQQTQIKKTQTMEVR